MINKYISFYISIFLFLSFNLHFANSQTLNSLDLESLIWIAKQYQLDWNISATTCKGVMGTSINNILCNSNGYVTKIILDYSRTAVDNGSPGPLVKLQMEYLISFQVSGGPPVKDSSQSILDLLDGPLSYNLENIMIENHYVGGVSPSFPSNLPMLGAIQLMNVNIISTLPSKAYASPRKFVMVSSLFGQSTLSPPDPDLTYSTLQTLGIFSNVPAIYEIKDTSFPELTSLTFQVKDTLSIKLIVNASKLAALFVGPGAAVSSSELSLVTLPKLNRLNVSNYKILDMNFVKYPINKLYLYNVGGYPVANIQSLSSYEYSDFNGGSAPNPLWFNNNLPSIIFKNTSVSGPLQSGYRDISPILFDATSNTGLTGEIPQSFCSASNMYLQSTAISKLPDCIYCYWNMLAVLPSIFTPPSGLTLPSGFICDYKLLNMVIVKKRTENFIAISGVNLGYLLDGDFSPSTLRMAIPNSKFTLIVNSTDGQFDLVLSSTMGYTIPGVKWFTDITFIRSFEAYHSDNRISVKIFGDFNSTWVGGYSVFDNKLNNNYTVTELTSTYITAYCIYPSSVYNINDIVYLKVKWAYGETPIQTNIAPSFPVVSSVSSITADGGNLTIVGYFSEKTNQTGLQSSVLINSIKCQIFNLTRDNIKCAIGSLAVGIATVEISIDNYPFKSDKLLVVTDSTKKDCGPNDNCFGNGNCVNRICNCSSNYGGRYCESFIYEGGKFEQNNTTPTISFVAKDFQFNFNMVGIQEINAEHKVERELITRNWLFNSTTDNNLTTLRYILNSTDAKNISVIAVIEHSVDARVVKFADHTFSLSPNSIKISLLINGWTYQSNLNSIRAVFTTILEESDYSRCDIDGNPIGSDSLDDSVQYLKVIKNGVAFYGRFLSTALSDGRPTFSRNEVINKTEGTKQVYIGINVPQCSSCLIDPDFSLLIQTNAQCSSKSSKWKVITIACVVGGVGLVVLSIVAFYLIKKRRSIKIKIDIALEKYGKS